MSTAIQQLPVTGLAWFDALRENASERWTALGFPSTHEEEWRFTNVAPIAKMPLRPASRGVRLYQFEAGLPGAAHQLVFVNGGFSRELSSGRNLPAGVEVLSLAEALRTMPATVEPYLARQADFTGHAFVALNTAHLEDGAFIRIPRGVVVEAPIHLVFLASDGVSHPRALVTAGANSQVTLVESYLGQPGEPYFTNAVTEIVSGENAVVDHYRLQLERADAFHVSTLEVRQGRNAIFSSHSFSFGGALVRNDVNSVLEEGAECTLNGLYLADGRQHVDNHTAIDHAKPHGSSHELYKGILDGRATAVFNGKIYVRQDAQKTDARQTNKNLVLSEDAVINTKPELQIWADDVRCTHGATIGQLDAEAIFYLQSRGIGKNEARDLLTQAFARDIIERVRVEPLRDRLEKILHERLHERCA